MSIQPLMATIVVFQKVGTQYKTRAIKNNLLLYTDVIYGIPLHPSPNSKIAPQTPASIGYQQKLPAEIFRPALTCRYIYYIKTHGSELHDQVNYIRCLTLQSFSNRMFT